MWYQKGKLIDFKQIKKVIALSMMNRTQLYLKNRKFKKLAFKVKGVQEIHLFKAQDHF